MPYLFLSKKDGSTVDTLNFTLPVRYSTMNYRTVTVNEQQAIQPIRTNKRTFIC
jgi:hypothetical protein